MQPGVVAGLFWLVIALRDSRPLPARAHERDVSSSSLYFELPSGRCVPLFDSLKSTHATAPSREAPLW